MELRVAFSRGLTTREERWPRLDWGLDVHPDAVQTVRLGDRAITFGFGPRKLKDGHSFVLPYTRWVNLGFYQATSLPDPARRLEGTGKSMRHVKVRSVEDADAPELRALVEAAVALRRASL